MNDIAELTLRVQSLEAQIAKDRLDGLEKQGNKTAKSADLMEAAFAKLMKILGPAYLAHRFIQTTKHAYELQESYVRLAEIAGTTSEAIGSLDLPARLAGTGLESVATSIARLSRAVGEAQLGDVGKRGLFAALGMDPDDGKDASERMIEFAHAIMQVKDQNIAGFASQQLLGRGFAEMRPFIKEIVEQGQLHSRTSNEQNEAAKKLMDTWVKLKYQFEGSAILMANQIIEPLQKIATKALEAYKSAGLFKAVMEGLQEALFGDDLHKAAQEIDFLKRVIADTQAAIQKNKTDDRGFFTNWLFGSKAEENNRLVEQLNKLKERLQLIENYKKSLDAEEERRRARAAQADPNKATSGGGGDPGAEARIRALMRAAKVYEASIAQEKGFAEQYSEAIKLTNALTQEAFKQGQIGEEAMLQQIAANEDAKLQVLIQSLEAQKKLHEGQGQLGKAAEADAAIKQANAARVANEVLTNAKITSLREVSALEFRQGIAMRSAEQTIAFADEMSRLDAWRVEQENLNDIARNIELYGEEEHGARMSEIWARYEEERTKILDNETKKRYGISQVYRKLDLDSAASFFGYMKGLMNVKSKELFEIGKLGAIGETIVNTYKSATGAYAALSSIPIVGPALGAAAAAAAVLAGLANVNAIRSTQYGGASAAAPVFNANPVTGTPTQPFGPQNPSFGGETPTMQVIIQGNVIGTQDFVDNVLIPGIRDAVDNRDFVIIGANSRQAEDLATS